MRERIWSQYNRQLVQRGSITFLISPKILQELKKSPKKNQMGRPLKFSDSLIQLLLMIKIHYRLTYRMLEGFAKSLLSKMYPWLELPSYSLICKRAATLMKNLPKLSRTQPHTILLDASGIKVVGEGEWKVKVHGRGRPRKWIKIHIAVDPATQQIVSQITTSNECGDSTMTKQLLEGSGKQVKTVIADGAYDRSKARQAI